MAALGGILKKYAYFLYLMGQPSEVVHWNAAYLLPKQLALTSTAIIMWWSYPVFLFYKIFRGGSFDFDFDELEAEGKKLSNKQAFVYHYYGDSKTQSFFESYKVHIKDFLLGLFGFFPWIIMSLSYTMMFWYPIILFPIYKAWELFTPWDEQTWESPLLWYSGAVEAGVNPGFPENVYTNDFLLEGAAELRQAEIDEILEKIAKKAE